MSEKIKKFIKFIWPVAVFCLFLFMFMNVVYAQNSISAGAAVGATTTTDSLGGGWDKYLRSTLPSFTAPTGATGEDIAAGVGRRGISLIKYLVGGIALILGLIYAMNFIFARGNEETLTKHKKNFLWVFIGFVILMAAENIATIFNPETAKSDALIDFKAGRDQLRDIANYLKWIFGSIIVLLMTISGIRMMTAGGNEETITKEKNHLVWSSIGMLVILLATNIVNAIYVVNDKSNIITAGGATKSVTELGGVIRLLLVFLGPIAVLFTIYAGFMYLTSLGNEDRANKAKRMIVAGVTGIVIVYAAFALVSTFLTADLTPVTTTPIT